MQGIKSKCDTPISKRNYKEKYCEMCSDKFKPTHPAQKHCEKCRQSEEFREERLRKKKFHRMERYKHKERRGICIVCGKETIKYGQGHVSEFCSAECACKTYVETEDKTMRIKAQNRLRNQQYTAKEIIDLYIEIRLEEKGLI